jgi:osmotically inducible protein OsmC
MSFAQWQGTLKEGTGSLRLGSGAFEGQNSYQYSYQSRFESGTGTNPEELIAAAHAACFSMALSNKLSQAGHPPTSIRTSASVHLGQVESSFAITRIDLDTIGEVPGVSPAEFAEHAEAAKTTCPVSKALSAVEITLTAKLG